VCVPAALGYLFALILPSVSLATAAPKDTNGHDVTLGKSENEEKAILTCKFAVDVVKERKHFDVRYTLMNGSPKETGRYKFMECFVCHFFLSSKFE
jgi:hypothetical protein